MLQYLQVTQPVEARIITALRPESSMPIRAGSLTLKMTPSFIRAHGTGLPAALALSGGFQIIRHALAELRAETELPPQTSRGVS